MTKEGNKDPSLENTGLKMMLMRMMCRWRSRTSMRVMMMEHPELRPPSLLPLFVMTTSELFNTRINVFNLLLKHGCVWHFVGPGLNISDVAGKNDCC